ncbi:GATA transcription factor 5-like [Nicotiana tabacum]|uniref:GATA transcription factor 5-like n=2 Tax=Nicotiana TaxID=4085 RepID=A0A1S3Y4M4_TOBAC|nr:PREDICTED: GATA transcription factor 5 [Nicotiana sylvestris]XP_016446822.1 PREDICTED: GATA transcription factor 5-like [Nicotiana tabacum]
MLYRTQHHSFLSPFNPFTFSSSLSPHPLPPPSFSSPSPLSHSPSDQGMDCVEGALKSSFMSEAALKTTHQQAYGDDLWANGNGQNVVSGDDFFVDDLLDFSNGFVEDQGEEEKGEDNAVHKICSVSVSVSPQKPLEDKEAEKENDTVSPPAKEDFDSLPGSELIVPADDLDSLEWLSHFVEDSFSEYSLTYPAGKLPVKPVVNQSEDGEIPVQEKSCFITPVQTKARTKRGRTNVRVWPAGSGSLTESASSSCSSSSTTTMSSSPSNWVLYQIPVHTAESPGKPLAKKPKRKPAVQGGNGPQQPRRCSHCGVQKTPQWRAGPMGAKTLCNACGVRFKSGRLLPEYRPACSPTFSSELHSNNHRKVLEMRRKKEFEESGSAQPVQSF